MHTYVHINIIADAVNLKLFMFILLTVYIGSYMIHAKYHNYDHTYKWWLLHTKFPHTKLLSALLQCVHMHVCLCSDLRFIYEWL